MRKLIRAKRFDQYPVMAALFSLVLAVLAACATAPAPSPTPTRVQPSPTAVARATPTREGGQAVKRYSSPPPMIIDMTKSYTAKMYTSEGVITFGLFASEAPLTVNSFVFLSREGFYSGVTFHRIIRGFMVQSGDPTGTGAGGPGYSFQDEPVTRSYVRGTLAMANAGPNTNGSQFFIVQQDYPLPRSYTIFGVATEGLDILDRIANTPVTADARGEMSRPARAVTISRVEIIEQVAAGLGGLPTGPDR